MKMSKKILIAEDDHAIMEVVKIILQDAGYDIVGLTDGDEIIKRIVEHAPDLVLMDIWMGGQDGGLIARQLKLQKNTHHIPIVMISANNETEKISREAGANDFLLKPFNVDDLLKMVEKHTKNKK